jgi:hypothetical protein
VQGGTRRRHVGLEIWPCEVSYRRWDRGSDHLVEILRQRRLWHQAVGLRVGWPASEWDLRLRLNHFDKFRSLG